MLRGPRFASLALVLPALAAASSTPPITVELRDYATLPITGTMDGTGQTDGMLARVNSLREEPGGAKPLFRERLERSALHPRQENENVHDLSRLQRTNGHSGLFHKLSLRDRLRQRPRQPAVLDPDYRRNGRFYTIHIEDPAVEGTARPDNAHIPAFDVRGYDDDRLPSTHRATFNAKPCSSSGPTRIRRTRHSKGPRESCCACGSTRGSILLGDLVFNPTARPGEPEWRVLYIGSGDSGSGESRTSRSAPTLSGSIHSSARFCGSFPISDSDTASSAVSQNGRYRIPNDNPFVSTPGARERSGRTDFAIPIVCTGPSMPTNPGEQPSRRRLDWIAHLGDGEHRPQRRQLRILAARRQPGSSNAAIRPVRCPPTTASPY